MSLDSLACAAIEKDLKFIFVGGKGGVGKTTSSSAIATMLATLCKRRVLLVSTDPAHSLSDAWRMEFSNVPMSPIPNLDVMEVNPQETLENELKHWIEYSEEMFGNGKGEDDEFAKKIHSFQDWLSGIPGIDEATALSSAISHIESGKYDLIVFDTAPTGHTLKLLALPDILEQGITQLQSWQSSLWGYWEAFKGLSSAATGSSSRMPAAKKRASARDEMTTKLSDYKTSIQKVATMLQDQKRTRFVVVCIAEYLSVCETRRLLQELHKHKVRASHIVVNQLVGQDALSNDELTQLESLAEVGNLQMSQSLLQKTIHSCRLTTARTNIQEKYLKALKGYPETQHMMDGICEVPLLAEEVTGSEAIAKFSKLLIDKPDLSGLSVSDDGDNTDQNKKRHVPPAQTFAIGDTVLISGLAKAPRYNNLKGSVVSGQHADTGRYGISILHQGKTRTLALQAKNLTCLHSAVKKRKIESDAHHSDKSHDTTAKETTRPAVVSNGMVEKAKQILEDPEIQAMVEHNPKFRVAIDDCLSNPTNVMQYFGDPEMKGFIAKAMSKF